MSPIRGKRVANETSGAFDVTSPHSDGVSAGAGYGYGYGYDYGNGGGEGTAETGERERNRFSSGKDTSFVMLRPERVLEVRYDQMEGERFRHTAQFERWRDDRDPRSCGYDQLEVPAKYDLANVLD